MKFTDADQARKADKLQRVLQMLADASTHRGEKAEVYCWRGDGYVVMRIHRDSHGYKFGFDETIEDGLDLGQAFVRLAKKVDLQISLNPGLSWAAWEADRIILNIASTGKGEVVELVGSAVEEVDQELYHSADEFDPFDACPESFDMDDDDDGDDDEETKELRGIMTRARWRRQNATGGEDTKDEEDEMQKDRRKTEAEATQAPAHVWPDRPQVFKAPEARGGLGPWRPGGVDDHAPLKLERTGGPALELEIIRPGHGDGDKAIGRSEKRLAIPMVPTTLIAAFVSAACVLVALFGTAGVVAYHVLGK